MLYKLIVWFILASTMTGGLALANSEIDPTALTSQNVAKLFSNERLSLSSQQEINEEPTSTATPLPTEESTPTAEMTPTVEDTPTVDVMPIAEVTPPGRGEVCASLDHPVAGRIAQEYGVSSDDILKWFCEDNMGFGEIELAYAIARQTGSPVDAIFAQRLGGEGWGNIKKDNGVQGNIKSNNNPNTQDYSPGNSQGNQKKNSTNPGKSHLKGPKTKR